MSSETIRDRILESLQNLPSDATYGDAIERLVFLARIEQAWLNLMWEKALRMTRSIVGSGCDGYIRAMYSPTRAFSLSTPKMDFRFTSKNGKSRTINSE